MQLYLSPSRLLCSSGARVLTLMAALLQIAVGLCHLLGTWSLELSSDSVGPGTPAVHLWHHLGTSGSDSRTVSMVRAGRYLFLSSKYQPFDSA